MELDNVLAATRSGEHGITCTKSVRNSEPKNVSKENEKKAIQVGTNRENLREEMCNWIERTITGNVL